MYLSQLSRRGLLPPFGRCGTQGSGDKTEVFFFFFEVDTLPIRPFAGVCSDMFPQITERREELCASFLITVERVARVDPLVRFQSATQQNTRSRGSHDLSPLSPPIHTGRVSRHVAKKWVSTVCFCCYSTLCV